MQKIFAQVNLPGDNGKLIAQGVLQIVGELPPELENAGNDNLMKVGNGLRVTLHLLGAAQVDELERSQQKFGPAFALAAMVDVTDDPHPGDQDGPGE